MGSQLAIPHPCLTWIPALFLNTNNGDNNNGDNNNNTLWMNFKVYKKAVYKEGSLGYIYIIQ